LVAEIDKLRADAEATALERDADKPKETRRRELCSKFKCLQGKLEANILRRSKAEQDVAAARIQLEKKLEQFMRLQEIVEQQDRKVRELHPELGAAPPFRLLRE
jgi:hypothetical protein